MPNVNDLRESRFLKQDDVVIPQLVTIAGWDRVNVASPDQAEDLKYTLKFKEDLKPLSW